MLRSSARGRHRCHPRALKDPAALCAGAMPRRPGIRTDAIRALAHPFGADVDGHDRADHWLPYIMEAVARRSHNEELDSGGYCCFDCWLVRGGLHGPSPPESPTDTGRAGQALGKHQKKWCPLRQKHWISQYCVPPGSRRESRGTGAETPLSELKTINPVLYVWIRGR